MNKLNMLFRDKEGKLMNVKRQDFYNETDYYNKILDLKGCRILDIVDEYSNNDFIFKKMSELMRGISSSN